MAALTQSQLDQLTKRLNEDNQALLREVRDELENSGDQHRIDLLNSEPGDAGDESMANALADFNVAILDRYIQGMRDIETDSNDVAICTATIALAHNLGLTVVAEGVETEAQRLLLTSHQCDFMQGYLFSKPLPAEAALAFIKGQNTAPA